MIPQLPPHESEPLVALRAQFKAICLVLGSNRNLFTIAQPDGAAHVEFHDGLYHYVIVERGTKFQHRTTSDPDEVLYWLTSNVVGEVASTYEVQNRNPLQDSRRIMFAKHEELMSALHAHWGERSRYEHEKILEQYPFDDRGSGSRVSQDGSQPRRVNWERIARISLLLSLLVVLTLAVKPVVSCLMGLAGQPALQQQAASLSPQDLIRIWTAIADQPYPGGPSLPKYGGADAVTKRKPVMLLDRSTQTCPGGREEQMCASNLDQALLSSPAVRAFVSAQARQALLLANAAQVQVRLPESTYIHGASTDHVNAVLTDINWPAFYKAYPGTAGYLQLSVPVVVDGSHSLVYAEQRCHGRCGTGMLYLLARTEKGWKIAKQLELWVS
ncbi:MULTISPECIES: Imm63 family immunity protein [unclassified Xanthomonas]|uniref:Imm63 family immunity protein n=1 Tax=unclassified Xanthomonas TaxID=2643310 RepID=UPI0028834D1C|nr:MULTISPECIES: Imm63 family immunity protein [unclassified Xanthomonas]